MAKLLGSTIWRHNPKGDGGTREKRGPNLVSQVVALTWFARRLSQMVVTSHEIYDELDHISQTIDVVNCRKVVRGPIEHNCFSQTFRASPEYPAQNPRISRRKVWFPWVSKDISNILAPTPSRGRPPPHRKISGPKSLGLGSFFFCLNCCDMSWRFLFHPPPAIPFVLSNSTSDCTFQGVLWTRTPWEVKQPPEGPSTEDPSTQESHPDHAGAFHDWSDHQDQAL